MRNACGGHDVQRTGGEAGDGYCFSFSSMKTPRFFIAAYGVPSPRPLAPILQPRCPSLVVLGGLAGMPTPRTRRALRVSPKRW